MAENEEVEEGVPSRSQIWKHEGMVEWLESVKEYDFSEAEPAEVIAAAFAHRVEWRRSEAYQNIVAEHQEAAEAARAERAAQREAEKEARQAAAAAKAAEKEAAEKAKTDGKTTAKATKGTTAKATTTKATRKGTRKATAGAGASDPFA